MNWSDGLCHLVRVTHFVLSNNMVLRMFDDYYDWILMAQGQLVQRAPKLSMIVIYTYTTVSYMYTIVVIKFIRSGN